MRIAVLTSGLRAQNLLRGPFPPPIVFEFCDWAEERAFPGRKGWAQHLLMSTGYTLWTMPDYAQKRPPLKEPVTDGEYKMMGLSAYGEPRFAEQVRRVVRTERDQCRLDLD